MRSKTAPVSPTNDPAGYWLGLRSRVLATVYPDGIPTATPTVSVSPVTPPAGTASVVRLAFSAPGGRTGGTEARADWCRPIASRIGRVVVFATGHLQGGYWYDYHYCDTDGTSIPLALLAAGCDVIMVDMPAYGVNPIPQVVVVDGEATEIENSHPYNFSDSGPSGNRLFTDPPIWALDYVLSQVSGRAHFIGHSGGAQSGAIIAACESRYDLVYNLQSAFFDAVGSPNEFETWSQNPAMQAAYGQNWSGVLRASWAVPGRRSVCWYAPQDEYDPGNTASWRSMIDRDSVWLPRCVSNASVSLQLKLDPRANSETTPYHRISASQCSAVVADLLAH